VNGDLADVLAFQIKAAKLPKPIREHRFHATRRWRFDLAWPERRLFAEVDGGEWTRGRHARGSGMAKDCEKWNAATVAGWRGLRFVGSQVKSGAALKTLHAVLR
jgi:hypothetical protein